MRGSTEWVLVPREPTSKMLKAAAKSLSDEHRPKDEYLSVKEKHAHRWRMMVDAAPSPPFRVVLAEPPAMNHRDAPFCELCGDKKEVGYGCENCGP